MPEWLDGFDDLVLHYDELLDVLELDRVHLVGYSLGGWIAAEFAVFYPKRLRSLTLIVPAGLRIPGKPIPNPVAMMPDAFFDLIFNDKTNMHQVLPDFESLDEIVHQYGEGATLARLAWNPQYDLKLERRLRARHLPVAGGARRARPPDPATRWRSATRSCCRTPASRRSPAPATRWPSSSPSRSARSIGGLHRGGVAR